jgi:hypothetical protein
MRIHALSIVAPWGAEIAEGRKTLEIRSWQPDTLPLEHLLIVENGRRLTLPGDTDPEGRAVAVVRVADVHPWTPEEAAAACSTYEPGWLAWTLENIRPIRRPFPVVARRRIYPLDVPSDLIVELVS